jgi:hypothetical protein
MGRKLESRQGEPVAQACEESPAGSVGGTFGQILQCLTIWFVPFDPQCSPQLTIAYEIDRASKPRSGSLIRLAEPPEPPSISSSLY